MSPADEPFFDDLAPPSVMLPARAPTQATASDHEALQQLWAQLNQAPYAHDLFQVLRRIQAHNPQSPRLGEALRPRDEAVRVGQDPELDFAPANLHSFEAKDGQVPRIGQRSFGLFGPMGPMPLHLTEYVRERARSHGDPTMMRFADVFHHRAALLFFKAWAQSRPVVHRDRPWDDDFSRWVSALFGQAGKPFSQRDAIPDDAKRLHAAALARGPRNAEGLIKILQSYFGVAVSIESSVGHWLDLQDEDRSRLLPSTAPGRNTALGQRAVLGKRVWDRQSNFRLRIGPLSYEQYQRFLPGQPARKALRDWLRQYLGMSLSCETRLVLQGAEVPRLQMRPRAAALAASGQPQAPAGMLGLNTWLGRRTPHPDRADMRLRLETPTP
ncbi:type VI secretion system baseplate subunit TssG [Aquabacterium sp.]|uniref:type VI secretion system baseplate subunit TssG n=1 Tax=Aquabacterium sp. TaxID=1872578 RepID=UPI0025C6768F|nr:type VI secretion system baseplate subunit TssG [Aquabacterium sp.]